MSLKTVLNQFHDERLNGINKMIPNQFLDLTMAILMMKVSNQKVKREITLKKAPENKGPISVRPRSSASKKS